MPLMNKGESNEDENEFSSNSVLLATASYDHTIRFWQVNSGLCIKTFQHPDSQVNALEITPDRLLIAAAGMRIVLIKSYRTDLGYEHVRMYEINSKTPNPIINYNGLSKNVTAVGFHLDGNWMFTAGEDCRAKIWDLRNIQCQRIFETKAPVNCACLHPNQGELILGDQNGGIHIWNLRNDFSDQLLPEPNSSIQHIAIDPLGKLMAAVNNKGRCYIWDLCEGSDDHPVNAKAKLKLEAHKKYALKCKFSPDSSLLLTTSADQTAKLWKTSDFTLMNELKTSNQRWIWDAAFSSDSQFAITVSSSNVAFIWSVETAEIKREFVGHQKAIIALAFKDGIA